MISAAVMCLALNLYHEARGESLAGNLAVGFVTMNRVADPRYPDTVCGVVKQSITPGATFLYETSASSVGSVMALMIDLKMIKRLWSQFYCLSTYWLAQ